MATLLQYSSLSSITKTTNNKITRCFVQSMKPSLKVRSAISIPKLPNGKLLKDLNLANVTLVNRNAKTILPTKENITTLQEVVVNDNSTTLAIVKMHAILEAVLDRIEMHQNIGEQRENWNSLLLNSLNMITLTAATMAGMVGFSGEPILGLKVASTLLFVAGTGILLIMNKIQPSQLVEEQRNAVRLFKQLRTKIEMKLSMESPTQEDVEEAMEKVLALDRAYPLPLLGHMLEKFPNTLKPAKWWPSKKTMTQEQGFGHKTKPNLYVKKEGDMNNNGWSKELEEEMNLILGVIDKRDIEDYVRLGNKALKLNKTLAISGPFLMGMAAVGAAFAGHVGPWGGLVAAVAGSVASVVNTIEHGGQVGMVFEMYRNCAGFFNLLEETVDSNLKEKDVRKRENGELFEMKVALHLGRSLSELRDFAAATKSSLCESHEVGSPKGEFASKLF